MAKKEIIHHDIFGIRIVPGDIVIASAGGFTRPPSRIWKGKVLRLTEKGLKLDVVEDQKNKYSFQKQMEVMILFPERTCYIETGEFKLKEDTSG